MKKRSFDLVDKEQIDAAEAILMLRSDHKKPRVPLSPVTFNFVQPSTTSQTFVAGVVRQSSAVILAPVTNSNVVHNTQNNALRYTVQDYWDACDAGACALVAEILRNSDKEVISAVIPRDKKNNTSPNALHLVAEKDDLELFYALGGPGVHPNTFARRNADDKIPLKVAMDRNASRELIGALASKTVTGKRFPEATKLVRTALEIDDSISDKEIPAIQEKLAKKLRSSEALKKYGYYFSNKRRTVSSTVVVRYSATTTLSYVQQPAVVQDPIIQYNETLTSNVNALFSKVVDMAENNLCLGLFLVPEYNDLMNAQNRDIGGKFSQMKKFLKWTASAYNIEDVEKYTFKDNDIDDVKSVESYFNSIRASLGVRSVDLSGSREV